MTPKTVLFISWTDLVKFLQIPVNASNLEKFLFLTPKDHLRVFGVICITHQLQHTKIKNSNIDTIDTINRIYCIDK